MLLPCTLWAPVTALHRLLRRMPMAPCHLTAPPATQNAGDGREHPVVQKASSWSGATGVAYVAMPCPLLTYLCYQLSQRRWSGD